MGPDEEQVEALSRSSKAVTAGEPDIQATSCAWRERLTEPWWWKPPGLLFTRRIARGCEGYCAGGDSLFAKRCVRDQT